MSAKTSAPFKVFFAMVVFTMFYLLFIAIRIAGHKDVRLYAISEIVNGRIIRGDTNNSNYTTKSTWSPMYHVTHHSENVVYTNNSNYTTKYKHTNSLQRHGTFSSHLFPFVDEGSSWKTSFCDEFMSNKFSVEMKPCGTSSHRVMCYGSPFDNKMGTCMFDGLAVDPQKIYQIMRDDRESVQTSNAIWLLRDVSSVNPCPDPVFDPMEKHMVKGNGVKQLAKTSILSVPQGKCQTWINGTSFFFNGYDNHIYFKFLSWYSLHNGILNFESSSGKLPSLIIRIPETKDEFSHADYEHDLFPEAKVMSLHDFFKMYDGVTCFEHVILTPSAYSTNAFRCKMADAVGRIRQKCYNCNGRGLPGTRFMTFRRRALAACSLEDDPNREKEIHNIVVQVRKAYLRHSTDNLNDFHRVLANSDELINGLKAAFPNANVLKMVAEDMTLCDQIKMVHNADVFMGVHGAGLVHLWWLQDTAILFELVPHSQMSNPTFKMLSTLTGRRYFGFTKIKGGETKVIADTPAIIEELKKQF